jgi:hypothetical protein
MPKRGGVTPASPEKAGPAMRRVRLSLSQKTAPGEQSSRAGAHHGREVAGGTAARMDQGNPVLMDPAPYPRRRARPAEMNER